MGRRILLFTLALMLAVIGTGAVLVYVSKADSRALAKEQPVTVITATHDIAAGTSVAAAQSKGWFTRTQIARKAVPSGAVVDVSTLQGDVALTTVYAGQVLMPSLFGVKAAATNGLTMATGTLAVTVAVDDPMRLGSLLSAGSYVAVFDTFNSASGPTQPWTPSGDGITSDFAYDQATRLLLPKVKVLALGSTSSSGAAAAATGSTDATSASGSNPQSLVTLEVQQSQAEKLIQAAQTGHLYLALVNDQSKVAPSGGVDNRSLFDGN